MFFRQSITRRALLVLQTFASSGLAKYSLACIKELCKSSQDEPCACVKQVKEDFLNAFDSLVRIVYNIFTGSSTSTLLNIARIVALADVLGCLSTTAAPVLSSVALTKNIAFTIETEPVLILHIGLKCHSKSLFNDAMVHIIGRWRLDSETLTPLLPDDVMKIIEQENGRLAKAKLDLIFTGHYVLDVTSKLSHPSSDRGYAYFREIAASKTSSYTSASEISRIALAKMLIKSNLNFHLPERRKQNYLLCAVIKEDSYPWKDSNRW